MYTKAMVLSTTKRTAAVCSITNQNTGGGNKKAGFPPAIGVTTSMQLSLRDRHLPQTAKTLAITVNPKVSPSRPIGVSVNAWMKGI